MVNGVLGCTSIETYPDLISLPTDGSVIFALVEFSQPTAFPGYPAVDRCFFQFVGNNVFYGTGVPNGWRPL